MDAVETDDAALLGDALGVDPAALTPIGREPLGDGSVAGFAVDDDTVAYLDTSLLPVAAETGLVLDGVARVWVHPADPHLPALAPAAFGDAAAVLLARLDVVASGLPELVGYRPGRRAVLRVPTEDGFAWVKVVRPRRVERIMRIHTALGAAGLPVPAVRGWSPAGLLVIDEAVGIPATDIPWDPLRLLDAVDDLRARLATAPLDIEARTSLTSRLSWYVERLAVAMPDEAERAARIAALVESGHGDGPAVTIHGDLHFGQLFLDPDFPRGGGITGLVDVDTAGWGDAADDAAAFIGHAVASVRLTEDATARARVAALAESALDRWGGLTGVRPLTAVHLLGHALSSAAVVETESDASARARALIDSAEALASGGKSPLMAAFEAP